MFVNRILVYVQIKSKSRGENGQRVMQEQMCTKLWEQ
jgi:hypothetical protein